MHVQSLLLAQGISPFVPTDVAGCKMWLKADSLALADGDPISSWLDQSGNSNDGSAAGTARPTFKTNIQNGKPVVRFDGTTDVLTTPYTTPSAHTIFCVYNRTAFSPVGNTTVNGPLWRSTTLWPNVSNGNMVVNTTIFTGAWVYLALTWNGASTPGAWLNGTNIYTSSASLVAAAGPIYLGRSFDGFYGGDIGEIIIYDSVLSSGNRILVQAYLSGRWGI